MLELPGTLSWKLFPLEGKRRKEQKACLLHSDEGRMNKLWLQPAARTVTILVLLSRYPVSASLLFPTAPSAASSCLDKLDGFKTKHVPQQFPLKGGD